MKFILQYLKVKLYLQLALLFLSIERLRMYLAGKQYAKKYANGSIKYKKEFQNFDLSSLNGLDVILFVVFAPKSMLMYERYFEFLKKLNYKIIVISNGDLDDKFCDNFKNECILMGERHNIGRDFGVYKEFFQLLFSHDVQLNNVIICNDSMFANLKRSDSRFINFMKEHANDDFVGAAEFFGEPNYHVQSYFLKFSNKVLNGVNFRKFWNGFFITNNRRSNIHNGEIKLSQSIFKDGFRPAVFLGTDNVINNIVDNNTNLFRFITEFSANHHLDSGSFDWANHFREMYRQIYDEESNETSSKLTREQLKIDIARLMNRSGIISIIPFMIVDEFGFPFLKRDLVYHEIIDWMLIRQHAAHFDQDILNEYIEDQRLRKRPWFLKSIKDKLMFRSGMI